jgi:hypothetical protein
VLAAIDQPVLVGGLVVAFILVLGAFPAEVDEFLGTSSRAIASTASRFPEWTMGATDSHKLSAFIRVETQSAPERDDGGKRES